MDWRAAIAAEGVKALVAAFGRLDIGLGCAAQQHEMLGRCRNIDAKRGSGERLAIGAVADVERIGIDLRLEGDLAAMAVSVDLHASCPVSGYSGRGSGGQAKALRIIMGASSGVSALWRCREGTQCPLICRHGLCPAKPAMVDAPLTPQGMTIRDVHLLEPSSCPRKWPWKSGSGGCPGLLPFPAARLEITSSSRVEI